MLQLVEPFPSPILFAALSPSMIWLFLAERLERRFPEGDFLAARRSRMCPLCPVFHPAGCQSLTLPRIRENPESLRAEVQSRRRNRFLFDYALVLNDHSRLDYRILYSTCCL